MARAWRLTRHAEAALNEIAHWTIGTFGERQAAFYEEALIERCRAIADRSAQTRSCAVLVGGPVGDRLRFARAGQHFVIYLDGEEEVVILDFLHGRSNLPARLSYLSAQAERRR